ncbi:MAG TPA: PEGA domain-containing protein [Scandinavium sp.]|jgi:hypothetical protein|uniref:PEGA domain-containing protein n=1 Tax=Scandinavium sp. TaxID=2830653 RepID=UPI002E2EF7D5|nr:PEGA domain-containing protein [Scandinavium sp.]HEX4499840.1 PEGA domain-containing protein [Scandinavium sp.]
MNHHIIRRLLSTLLTVAFLSATSCATLIHGTHETVPITTDPPGASVAVGGETYITPTEVSLSRDREYQVVATKPGYHQQTAQLHSSLSAVSFLNCFAWLWWAVDLVDGAAYKLEPEAVSLQLTPETPAEKLAERATPATRTASAYDAPEKDF